MRTVILVLCWVGLVAVGPLHADEPAEDTNEAFHRGLQRALDGDFETARAAIRRALESGDPLDTRLCQGAAAVMLGNGEAGLAARLLVPLLREMDEMLEALRWSESLEEEYEEKIEELEAQRQELAEMIQRYEKLGVLEDKVRKVIAPKYVAAVIDNLTRHRKSIYTNVLAPDEGKTSYELKEEHQTARWSAAAEVAEDGRSVKHVSSESWIGKDEAWARFDAVLKLLEAETGSWKRAFAKAKTWPDIECEAWTPPKLPLPEDEVNVLRRVEFRWTSKQDTAPPSEAVATLSIFQRAFALPDGSTSYGGPYIVQLTLTSQDLR